MEAVVTTLPLKVRDRAIVIIKGVPVQQCVRCSAYLLEDAVAAFLLCVEEVLERISRTPEM